MARLAKPAERDGRPAAEFGHHLRWLRESSHLETADVHRLSRIVRSDGSQATLSRSALDDMFGGRVLPRWPNALVVLQACWAANRAGVPGALQLVKGLSAGRVAPELWEQYSRYISSWRSFYHQMDKARLGNNLVPAWAEPAPSDAFVAGPSPIPQFNQEKLLNAWTERVRWNSLSDQEKDFLFDRFRTLKPGPTIPRYWTASAELQTLLDRTTRVPEQLPGVRWSLDFGRLNDFLQACGIDDANFSTPISDELHARINGPDADLPARLESAFQPWVDRDEPLPEESQIRSAWEGLFAWLSGPVTARNRAAPWNVVIVPGNRSDLSLRVELAADIHRQSAAPLNEKFLVLSGAHPRYEDDIWDSVDHLPIGEAEAMAWYLESLSVGKVASTIEVKIDSRAVTTEETFCNAIGHVRALQARRVAKAKEAGREIDLPLVVVATSPYHVLRAHLLANRILANEYLELVAGRVHVMSCSAMYGRDLILDCAIQGDPTSYGGPVDVHPRLYGARVFIQEALKVAGGRAAGVF